MHVTIIKGPRYEKLVNDIITKEVSFSFVDSSVVDEKKIVNEVRALPPQIRGKIRYGKGKPLPLTRKGRLNYVNTSIVLIYKNSKLIDVYPKQLGERYFSPLDWNISMEPKAPYLYDEPLIALLKDKPELVNTNKVLKVHEEIRKGREIIGEIDLLLENKEGNSILVEVEEVIGEKAVTQLLSLAKVLKDEGIKIDKMMIVGFTVDSKSLKAAKEAGIEVWKVKIERFDQRET